MPKRPRASIAARACRVGRRARARPAAGPRRAPGRSLAGQLVLVEDALVEARREADVVDVALVEVDAAAQLAARDVVRLAQQALEQVRAPGSGSRRAVPVM